MRGPTALALLAVSLLALPGTALARPVHGKVGWREGQVSSYALARGERDAILQSLLDACQHRPSCTRAFSEAGRAAGRGPSGGDWTAAGRAVPAGGAAAGETASRRELQQSPASNGGVPWSVLTPNDGGGVLTTDDGLAYLAVPHAAVLGAVVNQSQQLTASACATACANAAQVQGCDTFNYCPTDGPPDGCAMDEALHMVPPGTCDLLLQPAIKTASVMFVLGQGPVVPSLAGAPLPPDLANVTLDG